MGNIFDDIGDFLGDGVKIVRTTIGDVFEVGGTLVVDGIHDVGMGLRNLIRGAIGIRQLRPNEIDMARKLFDNTIPYHKVLVCSLQGIGGKPFCLPGSMLIGAHFLIPGIGSLLAITAIVGSLTDKYVLFLGEAGYNDALSTDYPRKKMGQQFMHELTHVWQGDVEAFQWAYVGDSIAEKCLHAVGDGSAYDYTTGQNWNTYHAEQQANIIDDFWNQTELMFSAPEKHRNYPYIRDNILRRDPNAPYKAPRVIARPTVNHKMTAAEAEALRQQAHAFRIQGEALLRSGFPPSVAQGQALITTAGQIEAAVVAAGFAVTRIAGMAAMTPNAFMPSSSGKLIKMATGPASRSPVLKK